MKYLESLDPNVDHQDIGIGDYIWVEISSIGSDNIGNSSVIGVNLHIIASASEQHIDNGDIVYDLFDLRNHSVFASMPWVYKFDSSFISDNYAAYLDLDQLKEVLNYCDRISSMKVFM